MKKTLVIVLVFLLQGVAATAQQLDTLKSLYSDNQWERLDLTAGEYISDFPARYQGYYYKALAKHELQFYDSAHFYLSLGLPFTSPDNILKYTVAIASVFTGKNELERADSVYASAQSMLSASNNRDCYSLYDLWAENRWFAGKPFESEALLRKGLEYLEEDDFKLQGRMFNNLGIVNWELGKFNESLHYFEQAEKLYLQEYVDEDPRVAKVLNNQGVVYLDLGDYKKAEYHFKSAREIQDRVYEGNAPDAYMTYNNLAHIALREGDLKEAYNMAAKSLDILSEAEGSVAFRMNEPLEVQATVWRRMKSYDKANQVLESAIDLMSADHGSHSGLVPLYEQKAEVLLETKDFDRAYKAIGEAIRLFKKSNSIKHPKLGELYALNAQICLKLRDNLEAEKLAKDALKVYASQFSEGETLGLRSGDYRISKGMIKAAEAMGDVFLAQGNTQDALKAWGMGLDCVDQLRGMTAYIQSRMNLYDSVQSLNKKFLSLLLTSYEAGDSNEMLLLQAIERGKAFSLNLRARKDSTSDLLNDLMTQRAYWERQLYDLSNEKKVRQAQMELLSIDDQLDSLKTNSPTDSSFSNLQRRLDVPENTALLSFFHRDGLTIGAVVVDGEIIVKRLNVEELKRQVLDFTRSHANLNFILNEPHVADSTFAAGSRRLYLQLIKPFEKHIESKTNWIVSADNQLLNLNFGLLAKTSSAQTINYSTHPYVMLEHAITYLPSLNAAGAAREIEPQGFSVWNFNEEGSEDFAQEVNSIAEFFEVDLFENINCTESNFKSQASQSSLIHIGCHGKSGASAFETKIQFAADSIDDGELTFAEVGWMQLGTELVTLSACRTGSGIARAGEWTQSVAYGFISAGCPTVISSSWDIPDAATQEVMSLFYKNLAHGSSSLNALRQAQMSVLANSDKLHAHPYYWAGMIHQGEELKINRSNPGQNKTWIILLLGLVSGVILVFFLRRKLR